MPNITGSFGNLLTREIDANTSGMGFGYEAFSVGSVFGAISYVSPPYYKDGGNNDGISFNASRVSPIFGNSNTVQPKALHLLPLIKF